MLNIVDYNDELSDLFDEIPEEFQIEWSLAPIRVAVCFSDDFPDVRFSYDLIGDDFVLDFNGSKVTIKSNGGNAKCATGLKYKHFTLPSDMRVVKNPTGRLLNPCIRPVGFFKLDYPHSKTLSDFSTKEIVDEFYKRMSDDGLEPFNHNGEVALRYKKG
jgi:hypothetical protein